MNSLKAALTAGILVLALSTPAQALEVRTKGADTGRTVTLKRGDLLRVSLKENPSTGFGWRVTTKPAKSALKLKSNRFIKGKGSGPGQVGVPGTRVYVWRAVGTGETSLKIGLFGPQTNDTEPEKTFRLTVNVE